MRSLFFIAVGALCACQTAPRLAEMPTFSAPLLTSDSGELELVSVPAQQPLLVAPELANDVVDDAFRNCDAARVAGAAPIDRGNPRYGPHLDRDHDGVGCER